MFATRGHLPHQGVSLRRSSSDEAAARSLPTSSHTLRIGPSVFNNLRTLFSARNLQPSRSQALAHSSAQGKKVTLAFPITSTLFLRSFAQERKSTPLFSAACTRFCRNGGCAPSGNMVTQSNSLDTNRPVSSRSARGDRFGRSGKVAHRTKQRLCRQD